MQRQRKGTYRSSSCFSKDSHLTWVDKHFAFSLLCTRILYSIFCFQVCQKRKRYVVDSTLSRPLSVGFWRKLRLFRHDTNGEVCLSAKYFTSTRGVLKTRTKQMNLNASSGCAWEEYDIPSLASSCRRIDNRRHVEGGSPFSLCNVQNHSPFHCSVGYLPTDREVFFMKTT